MDVRSFVELCAIQCRAMVYSCLGSADPWACEWLYMRAFWLLLGESEERRQVMIVLNGSDFLTPGCEPNLELVSK